LNVILIRIPDLAERSEDIPLLVDHFIDRFNQRMGRSISGISEEALALLVRHAFPGNVRELENVLEHSHIVTRGPTIALEDLPPYLTGGRLADGSSRSRVFSSSPLFGTEGMETERQQITECLRRNLWNIPRAARELGMHRTTLWRKVKRMKITRP